MHADPARSIPILRTALSIAVLTKVQSHRGQCNFSVVPFPCSELLADLDEGESLGDWARDNLTLNAPSWKRAERRYVKCQVATQMPSPFLGSALRQNFCDTQRSANAAAIA